MILLKYYIWNYHFWSAVAKVVLRFECIISNLTTEWNLLSNSLYSEVNKAKKKERKKIKRKEKSKKIIHPKIEMSSYSSDLDRALDGLGFSYIDGVPFRIDPRIESVANYDYT